jgi:membrane protease YdiL (CAAX protease family)
MKNYLSLGLKGRNHWWRYVIAIILVFVFTFPLGYIPTELYIDGGDFSGMSSAEIYQVIESDDFNAVGLDQNIGFLTMLAGFLFGVIVLLLCYRYLHKKKLLHIFTAFQKFRWKHMLFGFGVWAMLYVISTVIDMLVHTETYQFSLEWNRFLPLLFICIFILPIQILFEELFMRGYLMQMFYNVLKVPAFAILMSAIVFAVLHLGNPEVEAFGWHIMMPYYLSAAIMYGILTVWDNGVEIAVGVHAANNILLALTVSYDDAVLQVDSIWTKAEYNVTIWTVLIQLAMFAITLYATYLFLERKKKREAVG